MSYRLEDYTFWGLMSNGVQIETPVSSLAYAVALVDSPENAIINLKTASFVLNYVYNAEEQCGSASDLLLTLKGPEFPKAYELQTPVMLTCRWSPISAMLERRWEPIFLCREARRTMACASGIWEPKPVENAELLENCRTSEELFWHVLAKIVEKTVWRGGLLSIIVKPGWSYDHAKTLGRLQNLTLEEAQTADRVIWQRTPIIDNQ
jgi:hypothetical protein